MAVQIDSIANTLIHEGTCASKLVSVAAAGSCNNAYVLQRTDACLLHGYGGVVV